MASYRAAQSPLKQLGRQRSLSNFKTGMAIRLGEMGRLEELAESGESPASMVGPFAQGQSVPTLQA